MDDLISRQAAIDALEKAKESYFDRIVIIARMQNILRAIPSAQPERKTGRWIVEHNGNGWNDWENFICPVCGEKFEKVVNRRKYKFCSNCGAKMEVEHE